LFDVKMNQNYDVKIFYASNWANFTSFVAENSDIGIPWTALASSQSKRKNCQKKLLFGTSGNSGGDRGYRGVPKSIPRGIGG
jgi:hypothetical protein